MTIQVRIVLIMGFFTFVALGCARNVSNQSTLTIKAPNQASAMAALPTNQTACYGVSVTGPGISGISQNTCNPSSGILAGYHPSGTDIELQVPSGTNRTVQVYLYLKDVGDVSPCQALKPSFSPSDLNHVYLIGTASNVELRGAVQTVNITMNFPGLGTTIAQQLSMPPQCTSMGNPTFKILTSSQQASAAGFYKLTGRAGRVVNNPLLTGTGYKLIVK